MLLGLDGLDPFEIRLITSKFSLIKKNKTGRWAGWGRIWLKLTT